MKIHFLVVLSMLIGSYSNLFAQHEGEEEQVLVSCSYEQAQEEALQKQPELLKKQQDFEQYYQANRQRISNEKGRPFTIPVVVHIIHAGANLGTEANPVEAHVISHMEIAAQRFRHTQVGAKIYDNPNYGVDTEIELSLASVDPEGNYTTGITRRYLPALSKGNYNTLAPDLDAYAWDKTKYCNLFIIPQLTNVCGVYMPDYDFTLYDAGCFWNGLVAHELGHYFGLLHTFNTCTNDDCTIDGDRVCDTPAKIGPGYNGGNATTCLGDPANDCNTDEDDASSNNPYRAVSLGGLGEQPDMIENYLDYTASCWNSFTKGQKTRMHAQILSSRTTMINYGVILSASKPIPTNDAGITHVELNQIDACTSTFSPQVKITNYGGDSLKTVAIVVKVDGVFKFSQPFTLNLAPGEEAVLKLLREVSLSHGTSMLELSTLNPNGNLDANTFNDKGYAEASYIDGTRCANYKDCAAINPSSDGGPGNTTLVNITGTFPILPSAAYKTQICISAQGDVGSANEAFDIFGENGIYQGTTTFANDCKSSNLPFCFYISSADYNAWKRDDIITLTLDPISTAINPTRCAINEICATINIPQGMTAGVAVVPKVFLQGPFLEKETTMHTGINNMIPNISPYADDKPISKKGLPATAVDWIWVELRSDANSTPSISYGQSGLLLSSGEVVDVNGTALQFLYADPNAKWHVLVKHRNHLGIMTAEPILLNR